MSLDKLNQCSNCTYWQSFVALPHQGVCWVIALALAIVNAEEIPQVLNPIRWDNSYCDSFHRKE